MLRKKPNSKYLFPYSIFKRSVLLNLFFGIVIGGVFNFMILLYGIENSVSAPNSEEIVHQLVHKDRETFKNVRSIRVLCMVNTHPENHRIKAIHVQQTWGRHCDKLMFASTITDVTLNTIGFNTRNFHGFVWGKQKLMMHYVYRNFLNQYDWFYKADDDTFVIMENLRLLVSSYSPKDPIYFGHKFNTSVGHRWGDFSGGPGYVMSRGALRTFVEKSLTDEKLCPMLSKDEASEDWNVPICMAKANVYAGGSRDWLKRYRFFVYPPEIPLLKERKIDDWYWHRLYYNKAGGLDCCSNYSISFHFIPSRYLYSLYYLSYQLLQYGIKYKHPTPPKKNHFKEVVRRLEMERMNASYRGY